MRRAIACLAALALVGAVTASCNGTTGDQLLSFSAYASGAQEAWKPFKAGNFMIQLTAAKLHIGAVYFDEAPPGSGFDGPVCIASGVYAAQVPGPVLHDYVDLLSSAPQEFAVYGNGTADTALSWDVWLTDDNVGEDDVNGANLTPIVRIEGIATDAAGRSASFGGVVTINAVNRSKGSSDPSQPGQDPLCKVRVVQIGGIDLPFSPGGTLRVTVDPSIWFTQQSAPLDFSPGQLPRVTDPNCNPDSAVTVNPQDYGLAPETPPPSTQTCGGSGQGCCTVAAGGLLFGGTDNGRDSLNDTWAFGGTWTPVSVSTSPPPARFGAGMATLGSHLVLFGGDTAPGASLNDTWMFDGTSWAQVSLSSSPSARERPSMATLGDLVVLFGGSDGGGAYLNDTWAFAVSASSGTSAWASWTQKSVSSAPPGREGASAVALGDEVVLFGGSGDGGAYLNDTWTFDGTTWKQVVAANAPSPRYGASMAVLGGEAVLFGGFVASGEAGDTWTFDGTSWTQVSAMNSPSARGDASMAPFAGEVVLVGGRDTSGDLSDTWTFDGASWTQVSASGPPPGRYGASMAFLPAAQTCLGALTCTNDVCGPTYCIPNTSFLSGSDPGATAGVDFFSEIISAAPFSVSYGPE
jgi:hypothetical protein